jgi:hypothetical protein
MHNDFPAVVIIPRWILLFPKQISILCTGLSSIEARLTFAILFTFYFLPDSDVLMEKYVPTFQENVLSSRPNGTGLAVLIGIPFRDSLTL